MQKFPFLISKQKKFNTRSIDPNCSRQFFHDPQLKSDITIEQIDFAIADTTKPINPEILKEILRLHELWLSGKSGRKANLSRANLNGVDLSFANLSNADLSFANLTHAKCIFADFKGANLHKAGLLGADFVGAKTKEANVSGMNIFMTSFYKSDLDDVIARGAV